MLLFNVVWGGLIDEEVLVDRLIFGPMGGVALDVYENELLVSDCFWVLFNVIIMSYLGGSFEEVVWVMGMVVIEGLADMNG